MKLTTRELATLAVFGAIWGVSEISLGSVLKTLNVPLSGVVLSAIGLTIALVGRVFVPHKGSTLFIGVIATFLKLFSLGGVIIGPMIGIITEALVAEIVLTAMGRPRRLSLIAAGALGVAWVLIQPFVTNTLLFGRTIFVVWLDLIDRGSRLLGIKSNAAILILIVMLLIHLAIGILVGWLSWDIARLLRKRLGRPAIIGTLLIILLTACAGANQSPASPTNSLVVSGGEIKKNYTRADLEALPSIEATFNEVTYLGVSVSDLIKDAGFDPQQVKALKAIASDGYTVNYDATQFLAEGFSVAYATTSGELTADDGTFRIVYPRAEGKLNLRMLVELQIIQ